VVGTLSRPRDAYQGIEAERLTALSPQVELQGMDLRNPASIADIVRNVAPSLWVQHAGYAVDYPSMSYDIAAAYAVNVVPLEKLYSSLAGTGCGVLVTGSSAEYSASETGNREDDACVPDTPYGLSKLTQTLRARQLAMQFGVPTRVARLYLAFGPFDNPRKLLPQVVAKLRSGEAIDLSACTQRRDFIGIADVCKFYNRLAADLGRGGFDVINVGRGEGVKLRDLLEAIARRLGAACGLLRFGALPMRPGEPAISYAAMDKARQLLGWQVEPLQAAIDRDLLGVA
jgi:nucleoside-diphosphate-sugar epimerase